VLNLYDLLNKKANSLTGTIRASCLNLPNKNREHKSHVLWKLLNQLSGIAFRHILHMGERASWAFTGSTDFRAFAFNRQGFFFDSYN
jgi:hypothetical protein